MHPLRVLIVEDDPMIALDVEMTLLEAGCEVCGVAASETAAIDLADRTAPNLAVVDIKLSPGDGRSVATHLTRKFGTAVLFASASCDDLHALAVTGAVAYLPKPYKAALIPIALEAVRDIGDGLDPGPLPKGMVAIIPTRQR